MASRPRTGPKAQQSPKGEVQRVNPEEAGSLYPRRTVLPNFYRQKLESMYGMEVKGVENSGRNVKLDQAEFPDMGPLSREPGAGAVVPGVCLVGGLRRGPEGGRHSESLKRQDHLGIRQTKGFKGSVRSQSGSVTRLLTHLGGFRRHTCHPDVRSEFVLEPPDF